MKLLVVADGHYYIDKDEKVYVDSVFDYSFYARYLTVFDSVYAIIRAERVDVVPKGAKLASGVNVFFLPVPQTIGVKEHFLHYFKTRKLVKNYIKDFDVAIFRVPGVMANTVSRIYAKSKKKYAIEVVVDPWLYFAKGTVSGIARPFVRLIWTMDLKRICKKANGVSYVTERYLQSKYPCRALEGDRKYFTAFYSSVELPDEKFKMPRECVKKDKYIISHVAASFSSYGKGHIVLMDATKKVLEQGYNVELWFVGDGPLRSEFEAYAKKLGIDEKVNFLGLLESGDAVRDKIYQSDLFVFPTKAEGLPRVVLEAMSEGLPVLSSPVCGIPEVLEKDYLIDCSDVDGYAHAIIRLINNPEEMRECSVTNVQKAQEYKKSILSKKRTEFYRALFHFVAK